MEHEVRKKDQFLVLYLGALDMFPCGLESVDSSTSPMQMATVPQQPRQADGDT